MPQGVANRDIKLENVLLTAPAQPSCASDSSPSSGRLVKLADFGLSTGEHNCSSCSGLVGTPPYLAPEVIVGQQQPYDAKVRWAVYCIDMFGAESGLGVAMSKCPRLRSSLGLWIVALFCYCCRVRTCGPWGCCYTPW